MVDTNILVRTWLLSVAGIAAAATGGIVVGPDLPEHFDPAANGPGVQAFTSGGTSHPEISEVVNERKCVKIHCGPLQADVARSLYDLVRDEMHGAAAKDFGPAGHVITCVEVTPGQDVTDPDTGWATVTAFFMLMAR